MPVEQMNISLSAQMARFIRGRVKKGDYTNVSEVVRDAVRRMQEAEAVRREHVLLADLESGMTKNERRGVSSKVRQGVQDIEVGRYEEYDADGLRGLARQLVETSIKKRARSRKGR
jgi:putative addiction module CopG family antidote